MKDVETNRNKKNMDLSETSQASDGPSVGEITKILQELDLSAGELGFDGVANQSLPDPDSSTLEMALKVLAQDGFSEGSFLAEAESRDLEAILKEVDDLGTELDGTLSESTSGSSQSAVSVSVEEKSAQVDIPVEPEPRLEPQPEPVDQQVSDHLDAVVETVSDANQNEKPQPVEEEHPISESTEAFERIEARVVAEIGVEKQNLTNGPSSNCMFDVAAEVERLHRAYEEKEADVKHLTLTIEKLIVALRQEKQEKFELEMLAQAAQRNQGNFITQDQLEAMKQECSTLREDLRRSYQCRVDSKLEEEIHKLRKEAAQQDRLIAGFQKENAKLYDELNAVKETFKKSLVGWEKEKNEFVSGMAQLREKMMVRGFLPASGDGEGENMKVLKELVVADRENRLRLKSLEESVLAARAELEAKDKALDAAKKELQKWKSREEKQDNCATAAQAKDLKANQKGKGSGKDGKKRGSDGVDKSQQAFVSEAQALRAALDDLKNSALVEHAEAQDKIRAMADILREEQRKHEALKSLFEARVKALTNETKRLEAELEASKDARGDSCLGAVGGPSVPDSWQAEKKEMENTIRSLQRDRQKLLVGLSSLKRGAEESKVIGLEAAKVAKEQQKKSADVKDEAFVAPPSVERKLAAGLSSYIHHLETRKLKEEEMLRQYHVAAVKKLTDEFKARERALQEELAKAKVQLSIQNDVLQQLRTAHLSNGTATSTSFNKLKKEKAELVEQLGQARADREEELAQLKRENETLKMVLNPNQEVGLRLCARVEELERLYKRKAAQFDNLWRRLNAVTNSADATATGVSELRKLFDSPSLFQDETDEDAGDRESSKEDESDFRFPGAGASGGAFANGIPTNKPELETAHPVPKPKASGNRRRKKPV